MKKQLLTLTALCVIGLGILPSSAACPCQSHAYFRSSTPCCAAPIAAPCCNQISPCCLPIAPCCKTVAPCCRPVVAPCCHSACPCGAAPVQTPCCKNTCNDCCD